MTVVSVLHLAIFCSKLAFAYLPAMKEYDPAIQAKNGIPHEINSPRESWRSMQVL